MRLFLALAALLTVLDCTFASNQSSNKQSTNPFENRHVRHSSINQSNNQSAYEKVRGSPYTVSYDERAITVDGERVLLLSGSIHYPRAPVSEWAPLFKTAREAGLNTIQTYVFWNEHEDIQGVLDFETESRNLREFLQGAQDAGLFINLRIGPYVCAEWYYGGLPLWLRNNQSIEFRFDDPLWLNPVGEWITYVTKYVEPYLARNGGPIILAQIENEYGGAGNDQHRQNYIWWCGNLTQQLAIDVPWVMCQQPDAPPPLIYACNGFYCHDYVAHQQGVVKMPAMYTENWPGWFQHFGEAKPRRPVEDVAYSIVSYIAAGGVYHNYYMWFGGVTYGKRQGGPNNVPSYDYDAPIDEYGLPHSPKYDHLKEAHQTIMKYEQAILNNPFPEPIPMKDGCFAYVYDRSDTYPGVIFLSNTDPSAEHRVWIIHRATNQSVWFTLPQWSVTIVDEESLTVLYNTHTFSNATVAATEAYEKLIAKPVWSIRPSSVSQLNEQINSTVNQKTNQGPLEQLSFTQYQSTYLYYSTDLTLTNQQVEKGTLNLTISSTGDYFYVFIDDVLLASHNGVGDLTSISLNVDKFQPGAHVFRICVDLMGLTNGASYNYWEKKGINGDVQIDGKSLIEQNWNHTTGLWGESVKAYDPSNTSLKWSPYVPSQGTQPWTWYQLSFKLPKVSNPDTATYYLTMQAVTKGHVYVNGQYVTPYWNISAPATGCDPCTIYGGEYSNTMCRFDCGLPSQSRYQIPRDVLLLSEDGVQRVVLFNEQDGDVTGVTWSQRT